MFIKIIIFTVLGYLSGSVLYAPLFAKLFGKGDIIEKSRDKNPGTANAFMYGGFVCGLATLICDLSKGFFPVWLCMRGAFDMRALPFVVAAPVAGHAFSLFNHFKGGKGIATSFGVLLGLLPMWQPVISLALFFVFFSLILRITPHYYRTLASYIAALISLFLIVGLTPPLFGFGVICAIVFVRMLASKEVKTNFEVKLLWKR